MTPRTIATYGPDHAVTQGWRSMLGEIAQEATHNGWLTRQLLKRDVVATYKQSVLGAVWVVIVPLVNVATFALLSRSGIVHLGNLPVPYPLYAMLGMAFWQIFSTGILSCGSALTNAGEMILRVNVSKKSLVLAGMGKPMVSCAVQCVLVGILCIRYGVVPHPAAFLAPLVMLPVIALTLGAGLIAALLNAVVRDTGHVLSIGMTLAMYLTPVLYARPTVGLLGRLTTYNPMAYFITAGRDLVLHGTITKPLGFALASLGSCALLLIALMVFHVAEKRIAERI